MKRIFFFALPLFFPVFSFADLPKIAVVDFTANERTGLIHGLPDQITEDLVNTGQFDVYERGKLKSIMQEQGFQSSGFTDPQTAIQLGKLIGIQYIVTGQISDYGREVRAFRGYNVNSSTTFFRLKAGIRLIDVETGRILFSRSGTAEESVVQGQSSRVLDTTIDTRLAEDVSRFLVDALAKERLFEEKKPTSTMAKVKIGSYPENADVEVDGVFYGNAGSEFEIPAGLHSIRVSLPGHDVWDKKVMIRDGMTFKATLTRQVDTRVEVDVTEKKE